MSNDFIKQSWEENALKYKKSHWVSWGDEYAINLEIQEISKHLNNKVLDVGCANGYSLLEQLKQNKSLKMTGIDFSESMIKYANENLKEVASCSEFLYSFIPEFLVGDIRHIDFADESFDVTYTTRTLINLPNWEEQKQGIKECLRVTKKGGTVLFSEAFWEPLTLLNSLRTLKSLKPLEEHDFNRYLKMERTLNYIKELGYEYTVEDFSSVYYLGSRFLRELITDPNNYDGYLSNPINEMFYKLEKEFSGGGFGIQQLIIIQK
jgi:ubiquinone/menaquinone biosynthesis C-methylase UbiE